MQKEIKDMLKKAWEKKVDLDTWRSDKNKKKRERNKEKDSPYPRKKWRELIHVKEFIHHLPKIFTHMHILIKVYDLFVLRIPFLT
jgi:hypothetical protein